MNERASLSTIRLAISLVYSAGQRLLFLIIFSTIVTSVAIAGQLLVGRQLLDLIAGTEEVDAGDLAPYLATLGGLLVVAALSQAIAAELRILLAEQVTRRSMNEVLDVATAVTLEEYEGTGFHDRLMRARLAASGQSSGVVFGLVTIVSTLIVAIGVVAVLIAVVPVLVPFAVIGYLPIVLVNMRNNRERHRLELEQTELQRDRSYLEYVLTDRTDAKEVRAFDIASTLRSWHATLWDTRMSQLRDLVRRRLALTTIGSLVNTVVLVATLSFALVLAARGSISIGDAAVAIVGLQQLSSRLQAAGAAFNGVHEGVTFLRDFETFRALLPHRQRSAASSRPSHAPGVDRRGPARLPISRRCTGRPARRQLRAGTRADHGDRRRQRLGQVHAGQAALSAADTHAWQGHLGRDQRGRLRSLAGPSSDRPGLSGLFPIHAHDPPVDRHRQHWATR